MALVAAMAVGPAQAQTSRRGAGGVIKPIDQTGCSARLRGERSQAYWSNVAFQTGEFRATDVGVANVGGVHFDGRDAEGLWLTHATIGYDLDAGPLLATRPLHPAGVHSAIGAGDVSRLGFGGASWSTRPIIGGESRWDAYPHATDAAAYGAYGAEDAVALVRVGAYVVPVDPWTPIAIDGPRQTREVRERLERGRQEWLRERGFVGAVRTFVNDAAIMQRDGTDAPVAKFAGVSRPGSDADASVDAKEPEGKTMADDGAKVGGEFGPDAKRDAKADGKADPKAGAVIRVNAKPITRISMPHAAGLGKAGTRVIAETGQGSKPADEPVDKGPGD